MTAVALSSQAGDSVAPSPAQALPAYRDELKIVPASENEDGSPAWLIQDPVRNRFFRIGWLDFELLLNWSLNDIQHVVEAVNTQTTLRATPDDVQQLIAFLGANELLRLDYPPQIDHAHTMQSRRKPSILQWLLHNYLFFRIPLVRPHRWLALTAPYLAWVRRPATAWVIGLLSVLGLYLVSRQWDTFTHTFVDQLSWNGILGYTLALAFAKAAHELGHAYAATHHGVRVAHMGVAFLVMFPMLYTDTSESWRLTQPRHRLSIAAAGMVVELAIAGLATLAWVLTPDGSTRNALFFLATTSWILTLAVNASPFMRFDGYFILSDILDIPNLHERAGALARTWLRRHVLGLTEPWPDGFSVSRRRWLIAFALTTWIYRLTVFLGIAVMVYLHFFKLLGIFLMMVELAWFIARPVYRELKVWHALRAQITRSRLLLGLMVLAALVAALLLPIQTSVTGHGWLRARDQQVLYSPLAAQLIRITPGREFRRGDVMFALESKTLDFDEERARAMAAARTRQMAGLMGLPKGESQRPLLVSQLALHEAEERASHDQLQRLLLRAPFDGTLKDLDYELATGAWVRPQQPLGILVAPNQWLVEAFVAEADLGRIAVGQTVRVRLMVVPTVWLTGSINAIDVSRTTTLPTPMLDATHGGPLVTAAAGGGPTSGIRRVARDALFRVHIALNAPPPIAHNALARVSIEARPQALIDRFLRNAASTLIRESGF